jgi:hypothetical protein
MAAAFDKRENCLLRRGLFEGTVFGFAADLSFVCLDNLVIASYWRQRSIAK